MVNNKEMTRAEREFAQSRGLLNYVPGMNTQSSNLDYGTPKTFSTDEERLDALRRRVANTEVGR